MEKSSYGRVKRRLLELANKCNPKQPQDRRVQGLHKLFHDLVAKVK